MGTMGLRSIQGKFNLLSAEGFKPHEQVEISPPTIDQLLGPNLRVGIRIQQNKPSESVDGMLLEAEKQLGKSSALVADPEETLGGKRLFLDKIVRSITGGSKEESLRRALQDWSADDYNYNDNYKDIFNHDYKDNAYMQVVAAVGDHITFIVTGHTHLERAIEIKKDQFYFNCGTWIRLLRFTDAMLKNTASFEPVYKLLANDQGSMKIIDDAEFPDAGGNQMPFVLDQTSAVSIKKEDGKIVGRLNHIEGNGTGKPNEIKKFEKALT